MEKGKKWVFIVNPVAGNGLALSLTDRIKEMISKHDLEADIVFTERKGHATELAKEFADKGYTYIIGVGGDGTMNEIARSVLSREDIILGLIAGGTGNDFIQILGFSGKFEENDWEMFFKAQVTRMDVGYCNGKIFLNGMGLGFDAQVASENYDENGMAKEGWKYRYIWHILKTLLFFREKRMTVIANGATHDTDCFINTVANGRRFAGDFFLTPLAIANDGLLDVCAIKRLSLLQRLRILLMVPKGTHVKDKKVNYFQTDKLSLKFPTKVPFHVDGELLFADSFDIGIMPAAVSFIYNPEGKHFLKTAAEQEVIDNQI